MDDSKPRWVKTKHSHLLLDAFNTQLGRVVAPEDGYWDCYLLDQAAPFIREWGLDDAKAAVIKKLTSMNSMKSIGL
jgi:hypothetical protein